MGDNAITFVPDGALTVDLKRVRDANIVISGNSISICDAVIELEHDESGEHGRRVRSEDCR